MKLTRINKAFLFLLIISHFTTLVVGTKPTLPETPIEIDISVSPEKDYYIEGDIVKVNMRAYISKEHPNYVPGSEYYIYNVYQPDKMIRNLEVVSSDFDTVIVISDTSNIIEGEITIKIIDHKEKQYLYISFISLHYIDEIIENERQVRASQKKISSKFIGKDAFPTHFFHDLEDLKIEFDSSDKYVIPEMDITPSQIEEAILLEDESVIND